MDDRVTGGDRPTALRRVRGFLGGQARLLRRAFAAPPVEEALVEGRLPLPAHLVALDTDEGAALLAEAAPASAYHRLLPHYIPQRSPRFCGPATIAIVLNVLHARGPGSAGRTYDQDSVFTPRTEAVKPRRDVITGGMGLPILAGYLAAHDTVVGAIFASEITAARFRDHTVPLLLNAETCVAVNYQRPALGQEGTGHISPLAAYHERTDRFLVLDVSRHRYPPIWVGADDLFAAMNTSAGRHSRGFVTARLRGAIGGTGSDVAGEREWRG